MRPELSDDGGDGMTGIRHRVQEGAVSLIARSSVVALGLAAVLAIAPAISASEVSTTFIAPCMVLPPSNI